MDKRINNIIKNYITSVAKEYPNLIAAYIFGSYAANTQKSESDIDIALILENLNDADRFDKQVQLMLLASQFDSRIEPHPISKEDFLANNPFVVEIKRTGIEVAIH